jgi:hypothetical protein
MRVMRNQGKQHKAIKIIFGILSYDTYESMMIATLITKATPTTKR